MLRGDVGSFGLNKGCERQKIISSFQDPLPGVYTLKNGVISAFFSISAFPFFCRRMILEDRKKVGHFYYER
jgi:hypothetical protein